MALHILVINSGSSSIKFSIFEAGRSWPRVLFAGEISGMGGATLAFTFRDAAGHELSQGVTAEIGSRDVAGTSGNPARDAAD